MAYWKRSQLVKEDYEEKLSLKCLWKIEYQVDRKTEGFLEVRGEIYLGNIKFWSHQHVDIKLILDIKDKKNIEREEMSL